MTTVSTESQFINIDEMNTTETVLENSFADLSVEFDSQSDYTVLSLAIPVLEIIPPVLEIMPPAPPSIEENNNFIPGQFKYISCKISREMLQNAYKAITLTETWKFVKKDIESFSFSSAPEIWHITNKMVELGYNNHSGSSFGWTMRQMQYIAKFGEESFKEMTEQW
jgi:hypothetical protein